MTKNKNGPPRSSTTPPGEGNVRSGQEYPKIFPEILGII